MENEDKASNTDTHCKSTCSRISKHSSTSSAALKAQAKAEAARALLAYSKKDAAILKQKTELEANLHIFSSQKAVAAAEAEVAVYEEEEALSKIEQDHPLVGPPTSPKQRTTEYVQKHSYICSEGFKLQVDPLAFHKAAREQCEKATNAEIDLNSSHSAGKAKVKVEHLAQKNE
ncbi:hypothetical protein AMECASPLE_039243 [Ameca splendens]|uniref:Uncharacterized protein n=1 Tax=Ameca splendens TaxID=208324 RepID=A0ABV1AFG3_9TELE